MSVHQKGVSQREQIFQVLFVWVQVSSKTHGFEKGRYPSHKSLVFLAQYQMETINLTNWNVGMDECKLLNECKLFWRDRQGQALGSGLVMVTTGLLMCENQGKGQQGRVHVVHHSPG